MSKWILLATLLVMAAQSGETTEARVVCYYTNWSVYRPGTAKFNPQNINPYLCTHLIYAFGGFTKENTLKPFDKYQDIEKGGYAKFTGLKTYNQNLKTMIAIGGWNEGSTRFSPMVASAQRRKELVKNTIKFMRLNKFDGLDLDWEYPAFRDGGKAKDRSNYAKLVQELREEFEKESQATGRPRLLLTMAVPAGIEYIDKGYDIKKLNRYLDWMNILSYDYHSAFEPAVNHHSPLYALEAASEYNFDSELNIDFTIQHYLDAGADRDKLVLGIPTYGRSFTLFNPDSTAIGAPADGPGDQGDATREKGYLAYYEICESLMEKPRSKRQASDESDEDEDEEEYEDEDETWTVVQPNPKAMGPYAFKGNQWVGYDDIDIVRKKAEYVAEKKLGGIMFWSIDNDDFRGKCHGKPYPLIEAAKESLYKSLGLTDKLAAGKKQQLPQRKRRPSKVSKTEDEDEKEISKNTVRNSKKRLRTEETSAAPKATTTSRSSSRRRQSLARKGSSTETPLTSGDSTPAWGLNTPEPPTTPDPGSDFKCEEEGFWPHPKDCKKYFWCLDSGPSNLGIVANQFTCPSGLHFNKAADSCDFARNVHCTIKKDPVTSAPPITTTPTTTTTTEAETTTRARFSTTSTTTTIKIPSRIASLFTTRRPLQKVTAATSSTTFLNRPTTTASPAEEEYKEIADELESDGVRGLQDEEDPKVIKELIDLIKKLGGVEQLEKHLAGSNSNSAKGTQTTTPAAISRLLYERVLSQARPTIGERGPPQQNSRGPQAVGLKGKDDDQSVRRERPQYTTINRGRPPTREPAKESEEEDDEESEEDEDEISKPTTPVTSTSRAGLPQYVNIRRARPSTTTEGSTARNALFERESNESDEEDEDEDDDDDDKNRVQSFEYASVNRFRPESSTSTVTTSKYKTIQRFRSTTQGTTTTETKNIYENPTVRDLPTDSPTEIPTTSPPVYTSPQYASVSRFSSTSSPVYTSPQTSQYASVSRLSSTSPLGYTSPQTLQYASVSRLSSTPPIVNSSPQTSQYASVSRLSSTSPPGYTSPQTLQYASVSRLSSTNAPEVFETTTLIEENEVATDINDVNVAIASPSFASENGIIKNADTASVLNAQITTLSNIPSAKDTTNSPFSASPVTFSTGITVPEESFSSTQRISTLFAKRTRPTATTATAKPQEISETTSANKVSYERKYANVIRTRVPTPSSNASSLLLRARLDNELVSDSRRESSDEDFGRDNILGETNETTVKSKYGVLVRRIRSTTPASQENQNEDSEANNEGTDYGSKRFVRPQSRFSGRRVRPTSDENVQENNRDTQSSVVINAENGQVIRDRPTTPRNVIRQPYRTRKFQPPNALSQTIDNEGSGNEFVGQTENFETTTILPRAQPIRRFRPNTNSFEASDLSSLTALDISRSRNPPSVTSTGIRNSQVNRRFRPAFTTTTKEPVEDSLDSDSSVAPVSTESPRSSAFRPRVYGARTTAVNKDFELNAEASEPSVVARGRKLSIARFPPRPFSRPTLRPPTVTESDISDDLDLEEENELNAEISQDLKLLGRARLTAPAIKFSDENSSLVSARPKLGVLGTASSQSRINVTKVISSNILLGKTNERNGILLLRRPTKLTTVAASNEKVNETNQDEPLENIHLSETNIEEKEHEEVTTDEENKLTSSIPRKRVIVKKLRSTTAAFEITSTESTIADDSSLLAESKKLLQNAVDTVEKSEGQNDRPRVRKILRRRPATSTTLADSPTTEKIETNDLNTPDEVKVTEPSTQADVQTTPIPRVRKVIRRKLKPSLKEEETTTVANKIEESSEEPTTTKNPDENESSLIISSTTESSIVEESETTDAFDSDLLEQTTIGATSTKAKFDRPLYKPPKRPLTIITSTEPPTSTAKVYSRKYSNGPFTTPVLPSERDVSILGDRPRVEPVPRRISLNPNRQFGRRPFTTARTTTTDEDEEYNSDEDESVEEPENKLVFVPADQLFTRAPISKPQITSRPPIKDTNIEDDEKSLDEDEYDTEEDEEEEIIENVKTTSTLRPALSLNRFNSPQRAPALVRGGVVNAREPNRPLGFNRQSGAKPSTEDAGKRFNRPVAFQPNQRLNRFGTATTASPQESTSKGYVRKYSANKPTSETPLTVEEIDAEAVSAKHKQLFSNPKRFTTTTPSTPDDDDTTEEYGSITTDVNLDMATEIFDMTESDTEIGFMTSTTEDSSTINEVLMSDMDMTTSFQEVMEDTTILDDMFEITNPPSSVASIDMEENTTSSEKSTTEPHHIFAENIPGQSTATSTTKNIEEDKTVYPIFDVTTINSSLETATELNKNNDTSTFVKTSSQLDRLFAVSRSVEVNSKQDKHRINKKNESRLIEEGELKQEKKPTLDKIGEVSRFTLIKIVEGDIPIYLTNLSHEYPVDNPPFNPIRIDEARNARALKNFTDGGIENLLTSESVSAAYNHRNAFVDFIEASINSDSLGSTASLNSSDDSSAHSSETTIATESTSQPESSTSSYSIPPLQNKFVPGAIDLDDRRNRKVDVVSPGMSESSTLALEALFKSDDSEQLSGRNAGNTLNNGPFIGSQPFVVYAAPQDFSISKKHSVTESNINITSTADDDSSRIPSGRSVANFVKIQVLRPDEEKISYAKGKEFLGVPAAFDALLEKVNQPKSPITISILNQTDETRTTLAEEATSSTTGPIVISIANLDGVVLKKVDVVNTTLPMLTEVNTPTEIPSTEVPTTEIVTDASLITDEANITTTEETITDSKISLLKIKPASITNGTLSKIAKKRPKLTFPRRSQTNQTKASNITRIAISPLASNQTGKNIPYTTPKYNRTNSYTSGRSRFTANRVQNVPVDTRKQKTESNKFKPSNSTSEVIKVASPNPDFSKKVTIKPLRPGLLRSPTYVPRRATTVASTQVSDE